MITINGGTMISRRSVLAGSTLAIATSILSSPQAAAATTLAVDLIGRRSGQQLFAHVMGLDPSTGRWFFLAPDGVSRVYPSSPTSAMTPLPDTGIRFAAAGVRKRISLPLMDSGRMYFSVGRALKFFVNPGGGIAQ